jgi:hypothetical protein
MSDVFISYAQDDALAARIIADRLASKGFSVFFDRYSLVAGEQFSEQIVSNIRRAKAVLALLSSKSQRGKWVDQELQLALESKAVVIPVLLDEGAKNNWLWPLLATRQSVELNSGTAEWEPQLDKLVRDLSKALGKEEEAARIADARIAAPQAAPQRARAAYKWIVYAAIVVALIGAGLAWLWTAPPPTATSRANLSGTDLSRADLHGADLSRANLSSANLSDANLSRANLGGADLSRANLGGANLSDADLRDANLGGALLRGALLINTDLRGANLSSANLSGANLSFAKVTQSQLAQLPEACGDANTKVPVGLTIKPCNVP